jgi:EpsI family protein
MMATAAFVGPSLRPTTLLSDIEPIVLDTAVPSEFKDWHVSSETANASHVPGYINSDDAPYSQLLERTYTNTEGYSIMVTVAYGKDQRHNGMAHRPEVCYPAHGFQMTGEQEVTLQTDFGPLAAKHMVASQRERSEPLTFWFTIGDRALLGDYARRFAVLGYSFSGVVADGSLFRISSLDRSSPHAYAIQEQFTRDLLRAMDPKARKRLAGLS